MYKSHATCTIYMYEDSNIITNRNICNILNLRVVTIDFVNIYIYIKYVFVTAQTFSSTTKSCYLSVYMVCI